MRFILWIGLTLLFVSVGYMGSDLLTELAERTAKREMVEEQARDRALHVLKRQNKYIFNQIVVSSGETPEELEFRARVTRGDTVPAATFGIIRTTCPLPAEDLDCWELASLYIDGVPDTALLGESGQQPEPQSVPASPPQLISQPDPGTGETPAEVPTQPAPAIAAVPPVESEDPVAPTALDPTHVVRLSLVNARMTPRGEIGARLVNGTLLRLQEEQGGWGFFQILNGEYDGLEFWVSLSVLEAV